MMQCGSDGSLSLASSCAHVCFLTCARSRDASDTPEFSQFAVKEFPLFMSSSFGPFFILFHVYLLRVGIVFLLAGQI